MTEPLLGNPKNFGTCFCGRPYGDERAHGHPGVVLADLRPVTPLAYESSIPPAFTPSQVAKVKSLMADSKKRSK
jgi:hypothetical protein